MATRLGGFCYILGSLEASLSLKTELFLSMCIEALRTYLVGIGCPTCATICLLESRNPLYVGRDWRTRAVLCRYFTGAA